jgi:hypothetical protein
MGAIDKLFYNHGLKYCLNKKFQVSYNTFILFFLSFFGSCGVGWKDNWGSKCNQVGGVW